MNKKLTSLSLAGVMLLSTASPVFAAAENAMKEAKEPSKVEQLAKDAKEAGKEVAKDAKEKMTEAKEEAKEKMTEAKKDAKVVKEEVKKDVKEVKEEIKKEVKTVDVKATTQKVKLDGKDVVIYGYNIDGYNYFKLRDLAAVLKDSKAKFGVEYKDALVTLTKGADYKVAETDQKEVKAMSKGMLTNDKVMVGDKALTATAYKVDDSTYYKRRDLGKELGFGVGYDEATKSVLLTSVVNKEEVKEEKVAPKLEELKEAVKKELANEKEVRESEAYKKADDKVKTNFENAVAAAKSLLADEKATAEQFTNELKALVEAKEQLGFKADAKVEEKKDAKVEEKKDAKEAKKEMEKDVKEAKKEMKKDVKEAKEEVKETAKEAK